MLILKAASDGVGKANSVAKKLRDSIEVAALGWAWLVAQKCPRFYIWQGPAWCFPRRVWGLGWRMGVGTPGGTPGGTTKAADGEQATHVFFVSFMCYYQF